MTGISQLKDFRLNVMTKIVPPGRMVPVTKCGLCERPAGIMRGRATNQDFIVPVDCAHFPYPTYETPSPSEHDPDLVADVERIINAWSAAKRRPLA